MRSAAALVMIGLLGLLAGCGEQKPARAQIPVVPPTIEAHDSAQGPRDSKPPQPHSAGAEETTTQAHDQPLPPTDSLPPLQAAPSHLEQAYQSSTPPIYIETGIASWYGPPYHNRRSSNGEVFDMNALTAAHRTLPLNSLVRVTNLENNKSVVVRINDRGPFVEGRIIDLSMAAAKAINVWRVGTARVRLEVLEAPASIGAGGRWCVQIGALRNEVSATELKDEISRRYHTAKVSQFLSPVGAWWVRVRVADDDRRRAEEIARETHLNEGSVFLVRLD